MKNNAPSFYETLENYIEQAEYKKAINAIVMYPQRLFDTPRVDLLERLFSQIPDEAYSSLLGKLFKAWIYFLCGENYLLTKLMANINEGDLKTAPESSLFYGLKALTTFMTHQDEGLNYARLSLDILEGFDEPFYTANARLTYGQLLSSVYRFKEASVEFFASYHLFKQLGCDFLSVVAIVNYGLKKHSLGEITDLIQIFQDEITSNSRVVGETDSFFNMMRLPVGIAFFELNKQAKAIEYLESARKSILELNYVHMFGTLELYLCYSYALLNCFDEAHSVLDELVSRVGKLNSKGYEVLFALLRTNLLLMENKEPLKGDCELLEISFLMNPQKTLPNAVFTLARLYLKGYSKAVGLKEMEALFQTLETCGSLPLLQTASLLLAEYYKRENDLDKCQKIIGTAVKIYKETRMNARFHIDGSECIRVLEKSEPTIFSELGLSITSETQAMKGSCSQTTSQIQNSSSKADEAKNISWPEYAHLNHPDTLTAREFEILSYIASGDSNEEIAKKLFITTGTAKWHINNIYSKLKVKRRSQAVLYFYEITKDNISH